MRTLNERMNLETMIKKIETSLGLKRTSLDLSEEEMKLLHEILLEKLKE